MLTNHSSSSNCYTYNSGHFRDVFIHGKVLTNDNAEVCDTVGRIRVTMVSPTLICVMLTFDLCNFDPTAMNYVFSLFNFKKFRDIL